MAREKIEKKPVKKRAKRKKVDESVNVYVVGGYMFLTPPSDYDEFLILRDELPRWYEV